MLLPLCFRKAIVLIGLIGCAQIGICADNDNPPPTGEAAQPHVDFAGALRPHDVIAVKVYQEEDLNVKVTIDVNGMVMLPLLGQIKVSGLTLSQATARIQKLYETDYLVHPQVNLTVEQFASRRFAVLGQVQHPGSFDFPQNEPINISEAIALAGGYTRLGSPSKVTVRRMENGATKIYRVDADAQATDPKKKPFEILPNDIITVGEKSI